uniref:Legumain n=1 Tax=Oncorhynchus mykiss TaxID=8022 RepID=A0A8C7TJ83_ONCMY
MFTSTLALLGLSLGLVANAFPTQQSENGKNWVVIVAGSNGWYNYRHQADACHAYQIVHKNGIPDEQIVVMMYDDLATNEQNPTPGVVINRPNGTDVYKGVPKDYTGDVSGRKIEHFKSPGLLAFPNDDLHVADLMDAVNYMHENKKYGKLVFYIEACESGSMMTKLPADIDVYATTAANSHESSYACYYDDKRETYLGDWYSVNWLEDSDVEDLSKETLIKQFKIVRSHTNTSHVMQFGNKTLAHMKVIAFQGNVNAKPAPPMTLQPVEDPDLTPSPDVPLAILKRKLMRTNDLSATKKYFSQITSDLKYEYALRHLYALVNLCEGGYPTDSILMAMESVCHFN